MNRVVIVDCVRTGLARAYRGSFNLTRSDDMVAHCIDALLERNGHVSSEEIEDVVLGCGRQVGEQSANLARHSVALSRLPISVPGTTISRACASGLNAIAVAANHIATGDGEVMLAGGVESVTGLGRGTPARFDENPRLLEEKPAIFMAMGNTAEVVARRYRVSRAAQDEYAFESQRRYASAAGAGYMTDEIVPMSVRWQRADKASGKVEVVEVTPDRDECCRPETTAEGLAGLPPAFENNGTVTAGNASQLADGAAMALLTSERFAEVRGLEPLGYFRGFAIAGCEPDEMGIGPVFAIPKLLERHSLKLRDIDLIELNEAFASQCVYCRDRLGIDPAQYNVNGGAIAIGHPFGMTGARLTGTLLRELRRRGRRLGMVSMCIGKGMGAAGLVEAC